MRYVIVLFLGSIFFSTGPSWAANKNALIKRGEYLVRITGCNDCHTPMKMGPQGPEPDMSRMLSGHPEGMLMPPAAKITMPWAWQGAATNTAFAGPWGVTYSANLTGDRETGLGGWTEKEFIQTIRTGKHLGTGRPILPPMPIPSLAAATDEDLKSIFAYLLSVPKIKNRVPNVTMP